MKEAIDLLIRESLKFYSISLNLEIPENFDYDLSISKDVSHGDFACNVAFRLAKVVKQKPSDIASRLAEFLSKNTGSASFSLRKVEVAGGGFINIYLQTQALGQIVKDIYVQDQKFGRSEFGKNQKVLIEYVSANPTGPLTIAHGRQAAIGDCLARILRAAGYLVETEYYLNDGGRQMNLLGKSLLARYKTELGEPLQLPEDGYQGIYMADIAKHLLTEVRSGTQLLKFKDAQTEQDFFRDYAGKFIMKGITQDLEDMDVHFDHYFSEQTLYRDKLVDGVFDRLKKSGHFYEQEGALWFSSTDFGDDKDRVVRKSSGEYTYLAPDIAYHDQKFQRGFTKLVNLLGPDHHGYIARLKAACQALGHNSEALNVLIVQLTTLYRQGQPVRMSTRAGEFVTLRELMDEVGKDATRYFFVSRKIESHLDFDLDLAKQKSQDNPVFYLQYAHARIASLLKFANQGIDSNAKVELLTSPEETDLIKKIMEFSNLIIRSSQLLEPHCLADYLRELAACFHRFYSVHRIVTEDNDLTKARLLLANACRIVLRNGLGILGISQPESM